MPHPRPAAVALLCSFCCLAVAAGAAAADTDVRVSSIGYLPLRAKRATIAGAASDFRVVRDADGAVVQSGRTTDPVSDADTGETVTTADFTQVTEPGSYHVEVDGVGRSVSFPIDPDVYRSAYVASMLGFYGWRCGTDVGFDYAGQHYGYPACHEQDAHSDPLGVTGMRDATGGWHDAGDYGKYTVNAAMSVGILLRAWEDYRAALEHVPLQIPETGGALPDFLAEIRWELAWLLKMQYSATDGRVAHKLVEPTHPAFIMPQADTAARSLVPYGTAATADFVAALAQASRVYREFDAAFAEQCLAAARVSYAYLGANPANVAADETGFIGAQYSSSDADDRLWAAAELWATTGDAAVLTDLETRIAALAAPVVSPDFDWPNLANLGLYTYLAASRPERSAELVAKVTQAFVAAADGLVTTRNSRGYGRDLDKYYWGSNGSVARTCIVLDVAYRFAPNPDYIDTCSDQLAFLFGRNSYARSFVTGLGNNPPLHIHHRPSAADGIDAPYPGLLVGGAWTYRAQTDIVACTLPPGACWVDDQANYEVNEVAINWNASLVYALASFVGGGGAVSTAAGAPGVAGAAGASGAAGSGAVSAGAGGVGASEPTASGGGGARDITKRGSKGGCGCRAARSEDALGSWVGLASLLLGTWRRRSGRGCTVSHPR